METVDWEAATGRNLNALLRIVAELFALAGFVEGETPATLPRRLRNHVLRILRPAESAVRRLIVIAAREVAVPTLSAQPVKAKPGKQDCRTGVVYPPGCRPEAGALAGGVQNSALPLLDRRKCFSFAPPRRRPMGFPRISIIGVTEPRPVPENWIPSPDDLVDAAPLCRRLRALQAALADLDGQARRLARWKARRDRNRTRRLSPVRPGWPPGNRKRPVHEIDDVLRDCHSLAVYAGRVDTS